MPSRLDTIRQDETSRNSVQEDDAIIFIHKSIGESSAAILTPQWLISRKHYSYSPIDNIVENIEKLKRLPDALETHRLDL